jgi:hypothetical protein
MIFKSDDTRWQIKESKHCIFKYLVNSKIVNDLDDIIAKRELAYQKISTFLNVEADRPLTLYFSPSREYCQAHKMLAQAAIPHEYFASLVYDEYPFCPERISYGHEIAHLLVYFWDKQMYHLEFLEEGLATMLDMSGANYHLQYLNKLKYRVNHHWLDLSLKIKSYSRQTDYDKAASFVKFLIDKFGIDLFKQLYLSTVLERQENIFYVGNHILHPAYFEEKLAQVYQQDYRMLQKEWLQVLGIKI